MGNNDNTKNQHYVPQMYLRVFSDNDRCFVLNPYINKIENKRIDNICAENYLYDLRDSKGNFLIEKNQFENALAMIEKEDAELLRKVFLYIKNKEKDKDYIVLSREEREALIGFGFLTLIRNPVIRDIIPEVLKLSLNINAETKPEKTYAWLIIMSKINELCPELVNYQIRFVETNKHNPFITSNFPISFSGFSIKNDFYMPLSPTLAMELVPPKHLLTNINRCAVIKLSSEEVDNYNSRLLSRSFFLISSDEKTLRKYQIFMDEFDTNKAINPYTLANLKHLEEMPNEYFVIIVSRIITEELGIHNEIICNMLKKLIREGYSKEDAINKMAYACSDEVKKYIICNKTLDWKKIKINL